MPKLVVIPVHGVSDHILKPGYADQFFAKLVEELKDLGVIPERAGPDEVRDYIVCDEVHYSEYGQTAEDLVRTTYVEARGLLYKTWDQLFNWAFLLDKARHLMITMSSDVFVYQNERCRELIRNALRDKITPYTKTGDAVTVVGHSLGAVVAFDTIYYNVWGPNNKAWKSAGFLPSNLFTMGAPILLFSLDLKEECTKPELKERFNPTEHLDTKLVRADGVWYNFLDPQDLIGYPLALYFKKKYPVQDIVVGTGVDPLTAHTDYWKNNEVVSNIAQRLKLDYQRINAT